MKHVHAVVLAMVMTTLLLMTVAGAAEPRGYNARPCGFDMDRNGILGEANDAHVGDGVTADPDGDGVNEDILYVDGYVGNDTTGDGSAGNPYKTVQKALNSCDGPGDGAEDIVAIYGTFHEELDLTRSGLTGYYVRDNFQFPNDPFMLIGWDKDNDGQYPPFDTDDEAVLDGGGSLHVAIDRGGTNRSNLEFAHFTIKDYGNNSASSNAAFKLYSGSQTSMHTYIHDVEIDGVNKGIITGSSNIVFNFWASGTIQYVAFINNRVNEFGSWFTRGGQDSAFTSGHFRFQNNTIIGYGSATYGSGSYVAGFKLWKNNDVEIIDNILDCNPRAWPATDSTYAITMNVCAQDWIIRNNEIIDWKMGIGLSGDSGSNYCQSRPTKNCLIDQNIIRQSYAWAGNNTMGILLGDSRSDTTVSTAVVEDVTITNNFIWADESDPNNVGWYAAIRSQVSSPVAAPGGTITVVGNTIYGLKAHNNNGGDCYLFLADPARSYKQQNFVFKNNILNGAHNTNDSYNVRLKYTPSNWVANGNVYDASGAWSWGGTTYTTLNTWQTASGEDADSKTGDPLFVDAANGDFHLALNDTVATGDGVDVSSITDHDIDGDTRSASTITAGADVPSGPIDIVPPTITAWHSAATHGRGAGEMLLTIPDDGSFCEPRGNGVSKLVLQFSESIAPLSLQGELIEVTGRDANGTLLDLSGVTIGVSLQSGDTEGVITFSPALPDYARYLVSIAGVTDLTDNAMSGDADRILTALVGDASGDLRVNTADLSTVRGARTKLIDANTVAEIRSDLTGDGRVNVADLSRMRPHMGNDATGIVDPEPPLPTYSLTVNSGSGDGNYIEGAVVNISADTIVGRLFNGWSGDVAYLADANDANTTLTMPALAVTVTAAYSDILPAPWTSTNIGTVGLAGSTQITDGNWTVLASGEDIWSDSDNFHFVYQMGNGDVELIARVSSVQSTHNYAKCGVMIRESLDANSTNAFIGITPLKATFQRRIATGGSTSSTTNNDYIAPYWVKLTRVGNTFAGYRSADGASWTLVHSVTITMPTDVYIGVAVTSHDDAVLGTYTLDNVSVSP